MLSGTFLAVPIFHPTWPQQVRPEFASLPTPLFTQEDVEPGRSLFVYKVYRQDQLTVEAVDNPIGSYIIAPPFRASCKTGSQSNRGINVVKVRRGHTCVFKGEEAYAEDECSAGGVPGRR